MARCGALKAQRELRKAGLQARCQTSRRRVAAPGKPTAEELRVSANALPSKRGDRLGLLLNPLRFWFNTGTSAGARASAMGRCDLGPPLLIVELTVLKPARFCDLGKS